MWYKRRCAEAAWAPWRLEYIAQADEEDGCIFCEPDEALLVHRGELALVLLNKFPYSSGHVMVAPARHTGDFASLDRDEAAEIHSLAASAMGALAQEYAPQGFNLGWNLGRIAGAGSSTTCTCTSSRAGRATRTSCRCSPT